MEVAFQLYSFQWVKSLFLPLKRTLDLEYQDGGDELPNLITEITGMRDPGLLISVMLQKQGHVNSLPSYDAMVIMRPKLYFDAVYF